MDLRMLEKAAYIIFEMCREHPELCPHDWEWEWTNTRTGEKHYKCNLCGKEETVKE